MIFQHAINHAIMDYRTPTRTGRHEVDTGDANNYLHYNPGMPSGNLCTDAFEGDREMYQYLQMEVYNMFGVELNFYETTYDTKHDRVWGEDKNRKIVNYWTVMSFFPLPKEDKVWSKFGIEGMNNVSINISKIHFDGATGGYRPQIGDIVQSKFDDKFYEIMEVKEDEPMYFLSKKYSWELVVRKLKIENSMSVVPALSASPIAKYYNLSDIFDVTNPVDVEKEDVEYTPTPTELPNNDPFGNW